MNFWLPIPFGGLAYASLEFERRRPTDGPGFVRRHLERLREAAAPSSAMAEPVAAGDRHGHARPAAGTPAAVVQSDRPSGAVATGWRRRSERDGAGGCRRVRRRSRCGGQHRLSVMPSRFEGLRSEVILEAEAEAAVGGRRTRVQPPSAPSTHELASSRSASSSIPTSRRWIPGSSTGTITSTRRSRLRSIRSGEPKHTRSGRPCHAAEAEDPRVLEVPPDDRSDPDPLRQSRAPRAAGSTARAPPGRSATRPARPGRGRR